MADMSMPQKDGKRKVQAPRIDFTPMVDLGFILITFFIYTTTMAQANTMEINMPSNEPTEAPTAFIEESTITLIPVSGHRVIYYEGASAGKESMRMARIDNIREVLLAKKKQTAGLPVTFSQEAHKIHVLIKPNDDCKYDDVVQLLDNMTITDVPYYALTDISEDEKVAVLDFRMGS